jgi:hypothetical protein
MTREIAARRVGQLAADDFLDVRKAHLGFIAAERR